MFSGEKAALLPCQIELCCAADLSEPQKWMNRNAYPLAGKTAPILLMYCVYCVYLCIYLFA